MTATATSLTSKLPPTTTVNRHEIHIDFAPNTTAHRTWTFSEHIDSVTVGHPSVHYEHGIFTTDTLTGVVSASDWRVVLELAFSCA